MVKKYKLICMARLGFFYGVFMRYKRNKTSKEITTKTKFKIKKNNKYS